MDIESCIEEEKIGKNLKDKLNEEGFVPLLPMERKGLKDLKEEIPEGYRVVDWDVEENPVCSQAMYKEEGSSIYFLDRSGSYIGKAENNQ